MQAIISGTFLIPLSQLDSIREVEEIGDYMDRHYKVKDEPGSVNVVPDSKVVAGDQAQEVENESAAKKLGNVEKELEALKLKNARREAVERILAEKRGVSRADTEAFALAQTYTFGLTGATADDVRKFVRGRDSSEQ